MLRIHHLGVSASERVVWLCEELGLPYELKRYGRDPATRLAPPEYKALHPAGTSPVIEDGDLTLAESGAIIEYIIHRHAGGRLAFGPDHPQFATYLFWFHYAGASLLPIVIGAMSQQAGSPPSFQEAHAARETRALDMIEAHLAQHQWFAGGEFTAADIMMTLPLSALHKLRAADRAGDAATRDYLQRVSARPAFERATTTADPEAPRQLL